jgi:hypothetical protein
VGLIRIASARRVFRKQSLSFLVFVICRGKNLLSASSNPSLMADPHIVPIWQHIFEKELDKQVAAKVFFLYQSKHQVQLNANVMHMIGVMSFY